MRSNVFKPAQTYSNAREVKKRVKIGVIRGIRAGLLIFGPPDHPQIRRIFDIFGAPIPLRYVKEILPPPRKFVKQK